MTNTEKNLILATSRQILPVSATTPAPAAHHTPASGQTAASAAQSAAQVAAEQSTGAAASPGQDTLGEAGADVSPDKVTPAPMRDLIRSGFVALIGRPNVGKSTLLNQMAGLRLAITSPKAQTTRQVIRAIIDAPDSQIIFLDTPGMHQPKSKLGHYMVEAARHALAEADVALLLIDANFEPRVADLEKHILSLAARQHKPVILVINKVDMVAKEALLPLMAVFHEAFPFTAIIPISARTGDGVDILLQQLRQLLPQGPRYFPEDSLTDQTERMLAAELIREQILRLTHEEIPHGTAVAIDSFSEEPEEDPDDRQIVHIEATILVERDSHKGIIIGKQGSMLKTIGTAARLEIERMLGCPCYLKLFVKVREDWRNRRGILQDLGYDSRRQ